VCAARDISAASTSSSLPQSQSHIFQVAAPTLQREPQDSKRNVENGKAQGCESTLWKQPASAAASTAPRVASHIRTPGTFQLPNCEADLPTDLPAWLRSPVEA